MRTLLSLILFLSLSFLNLSAHASSSVKTGEITISYTLKALLGEKAANAYAAIISPDEVVEWSVYVPRNYNPNKPTGVLVFIHPSDTGEMPTDWAQVLEQHNLIWIAARRSGNKINSRLRVTYAIVGPMIINRQYNVDPSRVYVSGFSGGGRIASLVATNYANIFKGAIFNSGVNFWGKEKPDLFKAMQNNRYIFITGTKDFNLRDTKSVYKKYLKSGISNIKLINILGMGHRNPNAKNFNKAIVFLDER